VYVATSNRMLISMTPHGDTSFTTTTTYRYTDLFHLDDSERIFPFVLIFFGEKAEGTC
jgi:hypothetical protein